MLSLITKCVISSKSKVKLNFSYILYILVASRMLPKILLGHFLNANLDMIRRKRSSPLHFTKREQDLASRKADVFERIVSSGIDPTKFY